MSNQDSLIKPYHIVNFLGHYIKDFTVRQIRLLIILLEHELKNRGEKLDRPRIT